MMSFDHLFFTDIISYFKHFFSFVFCFWMLPHLHIQTVLSQKQTGAKYVDLWSD